MLPIKRIVAELLNVDKEKDCTQFDEYYDSMMENAKNTEKNDIFSKTKLFSEILFDNVKDDEPEKLLESIDNLLGTEKYKETVNSILPDEKLIELLKIFVKIGKDEKIIDKLKKETDDITYSIKRALG